MAFFKQQAIERAEYIMREKNNWDAWNAVCDQIMTKWSPELRSQLLLQIGDIISPIEAKALHIFTFVQKHIDAVSCFGPDSNMAYWYVQYMILLCPIIELVGDARLSEKQQPRTNATDARLTSGAFWLFEPENPNNQTSEDLLDGYYTRSLTEILSARHYLMHGIRKPNGDSNRLSEIDSYEIPGKWRDRMQPSSQVYWQQLKNDDGSNLDGWISRLAKTDIYPFRIPGADYFKDGLIQPKILGFLV